MLKAMATWSVSGLQPLIQFADLQGCFLFNAAYKPNGMQLHITALGNASDERISQHTNVTLGPGSYDHLIRMCTGEPYLHRLWGTILAALVTAIRLRSFTPACFYISVSHDWNSDALDVVKDDM